MQAQDTPAAITADREITATRILNAPRDLVFQVFTDPKHVVHWWGPNGFTLTIEKMDVRPGGVWKFVLTMRMVFKSAAERAQVVEKFHAVEGLNQTLGRLSEYIAKA